MSLFDKIFRDKNGKMAVFQVPNVPIIIWGIATVLAHVSHGGLARFSGYVALVAIVVWASLEIWLGSSLFRRILGVVVLAIVVINRF